MSRFVDIFQGLVIKTLQQAYQMVLNIGPKIVLALIILGIGWVCALLIKKIVSKILKALGLDIVSEKTGLRHFLERGGTKKGLSSIVGLAFYWVIILSTLIMAFDTLQLYTASTFVKRLILYIPSVVVFAIFLILGIFLGRFFGNCVEKTARLVNAPFSAIFGRIISYAITGLAIIVALEQLNVNTAVVIQTSIVIFGIIPIIFSVIFIIGGRDIASSILAQRFLTREFKIGDSIEIGEISGCIKHIDFISTKIQDGDQEIFIPNSKLAKNIVKRKPS